MLDKNEKNVEKNEEKIEETTSASTAINIENTVISDTAKVDDSTNLVEENQEKKVEEVFKALETKVIDAIIVKEKTNEAVDEIEKNVAEAAENDESKEDEIPAVDYDAFSLEELVLSLKKTLANNPVQKIKSQVEAIKIVFNKKFGAALAEKKAAFLGAGGNTIDFQFSSPIKSGYNNLLSEYKRERDAFYKSLENKLNDNYEKREQVIENLKNLIEEADTATMYKKFKEIQDTWRTIGPVPKSHYNDTWKIYHHHVERFYDLLHLSNDFRDLEFKHNLEKKLKIIEKAEALAEESDINLASKELQELHKIWKEDIGPVDKVNREDIWQKFSAATKKIHDKRHHYFKEMHSKFDEIIAKKNVVINTLNAYDTSNNTTHNDWQKSIKEIEKLRQEYFNAGKLPYSKSEDIWQKFKAATKKFNAAKNVFYKQEKSVQQENLEKKIALIEYAESIKDSDDWSMTTNAMKKVQSDWKKIGHVPRKFSDDIWKRFKAACNHYFDRYHQQKNTVSKEQQAIVDTKKEFLESLKNITEPTKDAVLNAINKWKYLGRLPRNVRHLDSKFNKQIDKMLDNLSLDKNEVSMLKFTNVVNSFAEDNDVKKLDSEQFFVRKKIDEIVKEMQQLENNLGFFSNTTEDNPLVLNVKNKVNELKKDVLVWKEKLKYLKNLDY